MKNLSEYINESISSKSVNYWKKEIGLDPTKVDYSENEDAQSIIDQFTEADKLSELYDYLVSGIDHKMSEKDWIEYVAATDIADYETYNGSLK